MFENVLFQPASQQLAGDIRSDNLPNALLFVGPEAAGKLTCALELARVLACRAFPAGVWQCTCDSCLKHKSLVSTSLLLTGSRSCFLEVAAAAKTFLEAVSEGASHLKAARYLFVRSVRKLSVRFNPILWEGDGKVAKLAPILSSLDEKLEELEQLPVASLNSLEKGGATAGKVAKLVEELTSLVNKLEFGFMYDSVPVAQMRRVCAWARYKPEFGKKVIIVENADRMQEGSRNAMLKILEEPPEGVVFVLTATHRNTVMPTILSRLRPYNFFPRDGNAQTQVIERVFHHSVPSGDADQVSIQRYLYSFLPVSPEKVEEIGRQFIGQLLAGEQPDIEGTIKSCGGFEPRILLQLFFKGLSSGVRDFIVNGDVAANKEMLDMSIQFRMAELSAQCMELLHQCHAHLTIYNQGVVAALELLVADIFLLVKKYQGGIII